MPAPCWAAPTAARPQQPASRCPPLPRRAAGKMSCTWAERARPSGTPAGAQPRRPRQARAPARPLRRPQPATPRAPGRLRARAQRGRRPLCQAPPAHPAGPFGGGPRAQRRRARSAPAQAQPTRRSGAGAAEGAGAPAGGARAARGAALPRGMRRQQGGGGKQWRRRRQGPPLSAASSADCLLLSFRLLLRNLSTRPLTRLSRARFYSGAPAGPRLPPAGGSGRLLSINWWPFLGTKKEKHLSSAVSSAVSSGVSLGKSVGKVCRRQYTYRGAAGNHGEPQRPLRHGRCGTEFLLLSLSLARRVRGGSAGCLCAA